MHKLTRNEPSAISCHSDYSIGILPWNTMERGCSLEFQKPATDFLEVSIENGPERAFSVSGRPSYGLYFLKTCYTPEKKNHFALQNGYFLKHKILSPKKYA